MSSTSPGPGFGPHRGDRRPALRWVVLAGLVVVGVAAVGSVVSGELAQLSFEPTDASRFQAWAAHPLVTAGTAALGCCGGGLAGWFVARRRGRGLVVAGVAVVAAAGILVWGVAARSGRSHPEGARAEALMSLEMPPGYAPGGTQVDHADAITPPAATRSWTAPAASPACVDLHDGLMAWADPGTVHGAAGNTTLRCYWSAAWHGHQVDANVVSGAGRMVTVSVRLAG